MKPLNDGFQSKGGPATKSAISGECGRGSSGRRGALGFRAMICRRASLGTIYEMAIPRSFSATRLSDANGRAFIGWFLMRLLAPRLMALNHAEDQARFILGECHFPNLPLPVLYFITDRGHEKARRWGRASRHQIEDAMKLSFSKKKLRRIGVKCSHLPNLRSMPDPLALKPFVGFRVWHLLYFLHEIAFANELRPCQID